MGGSITGMAQDASVAFFNPGGLTALDSNYVNAGLSLLIPKSTFLGATGLSESMTSQMYFPFYLYGNYSLGPKISLGISVNTPFGLGTKWEDDWSGRYISREARLQTLFIQPTLAYKINDKFSIGAAPVLAMGTARLNRALPLNGSDGEDAAMELEGKGNGLGFNAGIYASFDKYSFGVSYRSAIDMDLEGGDATFSNVPSSLIDNGTFPESAIFNSGIHLPAVISAGVAYRVNENIEAILEFNYTGWEVYDSLVFLFPDHENLNSSSGKKYKNSMALRVGMQYRYDEQWVFRAGLGFDQSPVQNQNLSPELPDGDKIIFGMGVSYRLKKGVSLEASFMFEDVKERKEVENVENNFIGTYKSNLYVAGLGVEFKF